MILARLALPLALPLALLGAAAQAQDASCPHDDFEYFINDFARDGAFQRENTAPEVETEWLDTAAEPEPAIVQDSVPREMLRFPLMQSALEAIERGAEPLMSGPGPDGTMIFTLRGPDSGYNSEYVFRPQPCWTLVAIRDHST